MARLKTPTNVLDVRGAFKKDPARRRDNELEAVGDKGAPPARFNESQLEAWRDSVGKVRAGVLCAADGIALEIAAVLLADFRTNPHFPASKLGRRDSLLAGSAILRRRDSGKVLQHEDPSVNILLKN